jgi:phosphate transport system protein
MEQHMHTDKVYEHQLATLKETILKMGAMIEEMLAGAHQVLLSRDPKLAQEFIKKDREVDQLEVTIDRCCIEILALRQPAGSDLRFIILGLKISTDLERIGDHAKNICQQVNDIRLMPQIKPYVDLPKMFLETSQMVKNGLDAFVRRDEALAQSVCEADDTIDAFEKKITKELVEFMIKDPATIETATLLINLTHQIERIADHATNIAEEVIYLIKGKDIRHGVRNRGKG